MPVISRSADVRRTGFQPEVEKKFFIKIAINHETQMPIKIFTIPFNQNTAGFIEEDLNNFMLKRNIKILKPAFFESGSERYWSVFLEYEDIILDHEEQTKKRQLPELTKTQKLLLDRLFEIRKELAEKNGLPLFIIASNKQLADIAIKMPADFEQLKNINGFGSKKIKKYGRKIIETVKIFDKSISSGKNTKIQDTNRSNTEKI